MRNFFLLLFLSLPFSQVNASIIEADFGTDVTGGFTDTTSGLTWLDIDYFVSGNIGSMFTQANSYGVSLATKDQVEELFANVASTPTSSYFNVMGTKWSSYVWGYYDDGTLAGPGGQAFIHNSGTQTIIDDRGAYDGHRYLGAWAVIGKVPEPSILALMGLGIFGLGLSRRKMKK